MKRHAIVILALVLLATVSTSAQNQPRNLFVIDVSESMMGKCSGCIKVFPEVQRGLTEVTTRWLDLPASISIYTFYNQDGWVEKKNFEIKGPGSEVMNMARFISGLTVKPPESGRAVTHLYGALSAVLDDRPFDKNRATNIYLLTDGIDDSEDPASAKAAFLAKWKPRQGDWLFFIDLYPGGNPEVRAICNDPANHCSYHPVDARDKQAVASCFCLPAVHLSPSELDFGNILAEDGGKASLFVDVNRSCLQGQSAGFRVSKVSVSDFPDSTFAASVSPERFQSAGPLSLQLSLNRSSDELPRREYHGELSIMPDDLRYLVLPSGKISFRFGGDLPDATITLPSGALGTIRFNTPINFDIFTTATVGFSVDYRIDFAAGFDRYSRDPNVLQQVVFQDSSGNWNINPTSLPPGDYSFDLVIIPNGIDLFLPDGSPAPEKVTFTFSVPLPVWVTALYIGVPIVLIIALLIGLRAAIIKFVAPGNFFKMKLKAMRLVPCELVGTLEPVEGVADVPAVLDGMRSAELGGDSGIFAGQVGAKIKLEPEWRKGRDMVRIASAPQNARIKAYGSKDTLPAMHELLYHADRLVIGDKILDYTRPDGLERGMEEVEEMLDYGDDGMDIPSE